MTDEEDVAPLRVDHAMVGPAVHDDPHAYAGADGDVDAGPHVPGTAPGGLPQGGSVDVGVKSHGNAQGLLKRPDDGVVLPGQLRRGRDVAVCIRGAVQVDGAEAADSQGGDPPAPEKVQHGRHGVRRVPGGDTDPLQDPAAFVADGADHLGAAGLQSSEYLHVVGAS